MLAWALAIFAAANSVLMTLPPPSSRNTAARCSVDMPKAVPNSTTERALPERANM
jgi:hypothetical protein